jgi:hypothetical protein
MLLSHAEMVFGVYPHTNLGYNEYDGDKMGPW